MPTLFFIKSFLSLYRLLPVLALLVWSTTSVAQTKYWDMAYTEILVDHNKKNYSDNKDALNNQLISHLTVEKWKATQNQFKKIVDKIDKHLTQAFIIAADITTLYNIYTALDDMYDYQKKSLQILYKYPWAAGWFYQKETDVYQSAKDLVSYIMVLVMSYGDLNKMKVSARESIFRELNTLTDMLKAKCFSLYQRMRQVEFAQLYKNSKPYEFYNKDKEKILEILNNIKGKN